MKHFDPDAYLAKISAPLVGFDPDTYLASKGSTGNIPKIKITGGLRTGPMQSPENVPFPEVPTLGETQPPIQPAEQPSKSVLDTIASVPLEFMAAVNRGATNIADFLTVDQINAWRQVFGKDPDVQTITQFLSSATQGEFMEEGLGRDIVRGAGEVVPAAVTGGGILRLGASKLPAVTGATKTLPAIAKQAGSSTLAADIGVSAASGAGGEIGQELGGAPGRVVGSVLAPLAGGFIGVIAKNGFKTKFSKQTPTKQKIADLVEANGNKAQRDAFVLDPTKKATKQELTKLVETGSDDIRRAGFKTKKAGLGQMKDAAGREAEKQGMDRGTVSLIESATRADKAVMREAFNTLKRGSVSKTFAIKNRPGDAAGRLLSDRYDAVKSINRQAGAEINTAAKALGGKPANLTKGYEKFLDDLQDLGVDIVRDKNGKLKGVYQNSEFARSKGTQSALDDFISRSDEPIIRGINAHRLKRVIDGSVEFGRKSANDPLLAKGENLLKGLRREINLTLQEMSPAYKAANTKFADTKTAMDAFERAAGPSFNPLSENANKQLVNVARSLMSNNQKRVPAMDAINALEQSAKKYGTFFDDDILVQSAFMDDLETLFGSSASTSFGGQIEKATGAAIKTALGQKTLTGAALEAGEAVIKRGINKDNLIKAIDELLK